MVDLFCEYVCVCVIYIYKHSQQHDKYDIWVCIQKWGVDLGQFIAVSCVVGHVYNRRITIYFYPIATNKCTYTNLIKNPNYVGYHHITSKYFYPLKWNGTAPKYKAISFRSFKKEHWPQATSRLPPTYPGSLSQYHGAAPSRPGP